MTTKIVFKAMSDGRIVHKTIPIEHPKFDVIPSDVFLGYELPAQSVQSQVIDYLDGIDKSDIMAKYGFDVILDYYPKKHKVRKQRIDEVTGLIEYMRPIVELHPELQRPIEAIISEAKEELFGKGKSNETKAKEVLRMVSMSLKAATGAYMHMTKLLRCETEAESMQPILL